MGEFAVVRSRRDLRLDDTDHTSMNGVLTPRPSYASTQPGSLIEAFRALLYDASLTFAEAERTTCSFGRRLART